MEKHQMTEYLKSVDERLAAAAARKLGLPLGRVALIRWIKRRTGDIPVFRVPVCAMELAEDLGLRIEVEA